MKINKLDLSQFRKKIEDYISKNGNEDKVLVFISSGAYTCFTKYKSTDEILDLIWEYNSDAKKDFKTKKSFLKTVKSDFDGNIKAMYTGWYFDCADDKNVFILPSIFSTDDYKEQIDSYFEYSFKEREYGFFMDPYVYTGEVECDENGLLIETVEYNNFFKYCVFCVDMTLDEYKQYEKDYIESSKTKKYDDGLVYRKGDSFYFHEKLLSILRKNTMFTFNYRDGGLIEP